MEIYASSTEVISDKKKEERVGRLIESTSSTNESHFVSWVGSVQKAMKSYPRLTPKTGGFSIHIHDIYKKEEYVSRTQKNLDENTHIKKVGLGQ